MKPLDLVILCGGNETRLKSLKNELPKGLTKYDGVYIIQLIINYYCRFNIQNIYLLCGYKSKYYFKNFHQKYHNLIKITCFKEKEKMGTGGALFKIKNKIKNDFLLVNGDTICEPPVERLINIVNKNKSVAGIFIKKGKFNSQKLNSLSLDSNKKIIFSKKNYTNCGLYFFKKKFLKSIKNKTASLENKYLNLLIKNLQVSGIYYKNLMFDIGSLENFKKSKKVIKKNLDRPALFLDRDNTLISDKGYTFKLSDFKILPGVIKKLKFFSKKKYYIFIITNQAGIAKKKFSNKQFFLFQKKLKYSFMEKKIFIDDVQYCPHHPDALIKKYKLICNCRKPKNLLFRNIKRKFIYNHKKSLMIGDSSSDFFFAKSSKLKFRRSDEFFSRNIKTVNNY